MAIAKRPGAGSKVTSKELAEEEFIGGSGKPKKEARAKKVGFMVYFDPEVLERVDAEARRSGLSRSSWVQHTAIKALEE
ncbi:MAG: hypothetical protein HXX08_24905 [Chloroflexi bacterium]|uniref:Ribbon-helix-helix domain-containing protein n=1 Tax=Candidatus Chlorohelix allophototropha TaxID=3003348 RepID=A0A8T7MAD1_9CHLR|nr:hypothetical protein [Chloroflexota bacterium]WJW70419.1 ribbon-helix-helix domain-containing protein [Chloroflexota bacterium L227-S17]